MQLPTRGEQQRLDSDKELKAVAKTLEQARGTAESVIRSPLFSPRCLTVQNCSFKAAVPPPPRARATVFHGRVGE